MKITKREGMGLAKLEIIKGEGKVWLNLKAKKGKKRRNKRGGEGTSEHQTIITIG